MTEANTINFDAPLPNTVDSLVADLEAAGLRAGQIINVHSSLSSIGWVVGGAVAVIQALMRVLTPEGTLMMPAHNTDNSDPAYWSNPPVPQPWWQIIRDQMPAYEPAITPTRGMGKIPETFRIFPGVIRSAHPALSFAAWGKYAHELTADHQLETDLGEGSPLSRLYDLDGSVLLIGVAHGNNTSLHLAEYRAKLANKQQMRVGCAVLVDGVRRWVEYDALDISSHDFATLGDEYEASIGYTPSRLGNAPLRLLRQRPIVDYGVKWLEKSRGGG